MKKKKKKGWREGTKKTEEKRMKQAVKRHKNGDW